MCSHCFPRLLVRLEVVHVDVLLARGDHWLVELDLTARASHALIVVHSHVALHLQRLILVASTCGVRSHQLLLLFIDLATLSTDHAPAVRALITASSINMLFASLYARARWPRQTSCCISVLEA